MAKKAIVNRNLKRQSTIEKFLKVRNSLLEIIGNNANSYEDKLEARNKLQKLPRDSSPTRLRNRCELTGRSRGFYRKFGLGRSKLREMAMNGRIPGITKASW